MAMWKPLFLELDTLVRAFLEEKNRIKEFQAEHENLMSEMETWRHRTLERLDAGRRRIQAEQGAVEAREM
jgi:hypothetical protein